ncbi:hypothetical protein EDC18_103360 [Natranaerovirga pectinivora]|uniref:Uncharacterized protein n=1 Tax=Natranaerovirga pectinivora TaxID=682400 RepID=A0A4R3MR60_9FIRM|nr:hypothetical protein [Natranaerovirga pectinivora]TCT15651.1 hypothetical protein EDC18_103360 [Natranaerovirga pectinivora]
MNRVKKIGINIIILVFLSFIFLKGFGLYLSPLSAHRDLERTRNYGPSEVIHVEDYNGGKHILGQYDKWFSCNTVKRYLFIFWRYGGNSIGIEMDPTKKINYSYRGGTNDQFVVFGMVNDERIKKVEVILGNGEILTQTEFYEDMFLLAWDTTDKENEKFFQNIYGYDEENVLVFQGRSMD